MTADTDAAGDILFECGILKNIDEFNRQEHGCFKNFTQSLLASFRSLHALIIS